MSNYKIIYKQDYLAHAEKKSKSKYKGGFKMQNGRMNNSKEYNHDYYMKNKEKWNKEEGYYDEDGNYWEYLDDEWEISTQHNTILTRRRKKEKWWNKLLKKGKNFVDNLFDKNDTPSRVNNKRKKKDGDGPKLIDKGSKEYNTKMFKKTSKDHKYLYKVKDKNTGKTRYFYSEQEYSRYMERVGRKEEMTIAEDAEYVNKLYGDGMHEKNCPYATLAYDLRRRGYDVEAIGSIKGLSTDKSAAFYKNAKIETTPTVAQLVSEINDTQPDNCRGSISVMWKDSGAHIFNYEKINGNLYFIDAQTNDIYEPKEWARENEKYLEEPLNKGDHKAIEKRAAQRNGMSVEEVGRIVSSYTEEEQERFYREYSGQIKYMRTDNLELTGNVLNNFVARTGTSTNTRPEGVNANEDIVEVSRVSNKTAEELKKRGIGP